MKTSVMKLTDKVTTALAVAFLALQTADAGLTYHLIHAGQGTEGNPVLAPIADGWLIIPFKIGAALLILVALGAIWRTWPGKRADVTTALKIGVVFSGAVVLWNLLCCGV